jgi:hypothetical protein
VYEQHYAVLKKLYYSNKDAFRMLNAQQST